MWIGLLWLLVQLPYGAQVWLGKRLGRLFMRVAKSRRRIAEINLSLCFPQFSEEHRRDILVKNMESMGIAVFETGIAWWWPKGRLNKLVTIEGLEHIQNLDGRGALMLAMHFTTLEIGASLLSNYIAIDGTYRPHSNEVFDYVQRNGRERHHKDAAAIPRNDVLSMVRSLRKGRLVWFASDQDYGRKHSVFVPFFGVQAATVTSILKLADLGNARIIPFTQTRCADTKTYKLTIHPPLVDIPSGDDLADARHINAFIEEQIVQQPEQYLWVHRRFKTCLPGASSPYDGAAHSRNGISISGS
jgi:KDO2-lipid IV(A) lauroyltransferase